MSDMLIRNMPEELKRLLSDEARRKGESLSATALDMLRTGLSLKRDDKPSMSAWDALRPIFYVDDDAGTDDYSQIMDEIEGERKRDFGPPSPVLE